MGIRVHKFMGYGLTDVQTNEKGYHVEDPRINTNSPLLNYEEPGVDEYLAWMKSHVRDEQDRDYNRRWHNLDFFVLREQEEENNNRKRISMSDTWVYSPERGLPNVLVFRPLAMSDWYRFDDALDYVEETYLRRRNTPQENRVNVLRHSLYPFHGYMDTRTGSELGSEVFNWLRLRENFDPNKDDKRLVDLSAQMMGGFTDHDEACKFVAPTIPWEIRNLLEFAEIFTDRNTWQQLRPMIYTYWS